MLLKASRDNQPRYRELANSLIAEITSGQLTLGDRLPSEFELVERFKVSRYTVREALRVLEETGMITRRQGHGTVITGQYPSRVYMQVCKSFPDVLQYPRDTRLKIHERGRVSADAELAGLLQCGAGMEWIVTSGVRRHLCDGTPLCWTDIYLNPEFEWFSTAVGHEREAAMWPLVSRADEQIVNVRTSLSAGEVPEYMAGALNAETGSPVLVIVRRFMTDGGQTFEIDVSRHPQGRFSYSVDFSREWLGGQDYRDRVSLSD